MTRRRCGRPTRLPSLCTAVVFCLSPDESTVREACAAVLRAFGGGGHVVVSRLRGKRLPVDRTPSLQSTTVPSSDPNESPKPTPILSTFPFLVVRLPGHLEMVSGLFPAVKLRKQNIFTPRPAVSAPSRSSVKELMDDASDSLPTTPTLLLCAPVSAKGHN